VVVSELEGGVGRGVRAGGRGEVQRARPISAGWAGRRGAERGGLAVGQREGQEREGRAVPRYRRGGRVRERRGGGGTRLVRLEWGKSSRVAHVVATKVEFGKRAPNGGGS